MSQICYNYSKSLSAIFYCDIMRTIRFSADKKRISRTLLRKETMDHHTQFSFEIDNDNLGITPVENSFINLYMPQARGDYVKVYLYGLKQCFNHQAVPVDNIALSQLFNITEGDVKNAWTYWQDPKILSVTYSSSGQARVTYYNIPSIIMGGHHREETPDPVRAPKRLQPEDPAMEGRMASRFEKI